MAKQASRTTNTLFNFTTSIGGQLVTILMQFVTRTVFIQTLGKSYLGISGLFSNILTMLSLAEFGVGSAILFKLYEPIAKEDHHRIAVLMKFYKTVYRVIGLGVALIGLCLIPFLPMLIKDYGRLAELHINTVLIFLLYLLNSVASYLFFAYKSAIIKANQKEYLINVISYFFTVGSGIVQMIALLLFRNFELYMLIAVGTVIVQNIVYARLSDKMYPYINEKTDDRISWSEVKGIFKDCAALFLYKLNNVVLKATDNIVLAKFVGLTVVGEYSNYYVFYTALRTLVNKVFTSVSHSLGNLHASGDKEHEYRIFKSVHLIAVTLGGVCCVGIFVVADEFIRVWIGEGWVLPQPFALLMGFELYTLALRLMLGKYRTAMGLFQQAKYRPVAGMIINLVVSIVLVQFWGICGVLAGTLIADWTTYMWYDPIILHRHGFGDASLVKAYFKNNFKYLAAVALCGAVDWMICTHFLTGLGWFSVGVHAVICGLTVPCVMVGISIRTQEGQYVYTLGMGYIRKITKKLKKRG